MLLSPVGVALCLVLPWVLFMWVGFSGEWHDRIPKSSSPWLRSYARRDRLALLNASLLSFPVVIILYLVVR